MLRMFLINYVFEWNMLECVISVTL